VSKMMVFTGNANPDLARRIVRQLHIPLGDASVGKFSDGEIMIEINENVRGKVAVRVPLVWQSVPKLWLTCSPL
jgi:phosphoribosylpyrophosphate synthetase